MAPKGDDGPATTLIDSEEAWAQVSGEAAEKDFLHIVEVFSGWCGPSEAILSTYKRVSLEYPKRKIRFFKVRARFAIPTELPCGSWHARVLFSSSECCLCVRRRCCCCCCDSCRADRLEALSAV